MVPITLTGQMIETAVVVIDLAILDGEAAARMHLAELCRMQVRYLESLLIGEVRFLARS